MTDVAIRLIAASAVLPGRHGSRSGDPPHGGVASDRVYICTQLPVVPVSFYLAFPSVPCAGRILCVGSLFLLHFPGGCPRRTLSVILPCDARTFLMPIPCGVMTRGSPACGSIIAWVCRNVKGRASEKRKVKSGGRNLPRPISKNRNGCAALREIQPHNRFIHWKPKVSFLNYSLFSRLSSLSSSCISLFHLL